MQAPAESHLFEREPGGSGLQTPARNSTGDVPWVLQTRGPWTKGTPPGRNRPSVPRGTVERRIENRLSPMRVLDAWPALKNPGRNLRSYARIRPSVPRGTCQALRVTIRSRVIGFIEDFPTMGLRDGRCVPRGTSWLLKWVRKCWPIDCDASAILAMRPAPNYVVANYNRFALCCEQLRFS